MALTGNIVAKVNLAESFSTEFVADVDQAFLGDRSSQEWFYKAIRSGYRHGWLHHEGSLSPRPNLLFVDGCGINYPRKAFLACFVDIMLDLPTIGITKSVLCGENVVSHCLLSKADERPPARRSSTTSCQKTAAGP